LLAATLFRALPLLENRFHPDEALYASFGRLIASGHDPMLAGVVVDKPPLSFYLSAGSFLLLGNTEFAARLAPFFAGVVSVALLFVLARRLYGRLAAHLAAWALACSPFAILFSITIFIDPLLSALGLWGVTMFVQTGQGASRRQEWAGALAFALAFAVKQTALLFVPLTLALMLPGLPEAPGPALRRLLRAALFIAGGLAVSAALVFAWDAARQASIGFWQQGYADNTPGRFIRAGEVMPRALAWLDWLRYVTASVPLNLVCLLGTPALLVVAARQRSRAAVADFVVAGFLLLYLAAYWLLAFNVWDRYLLPVVPLVALWLGRIVAQASAILARLGVAGFRAWAPRLASIVMVGLLLPPALTAARSGYPVGGDHGAYDGLDDAARFLNAVPPGGVLYDHWLGWQWGFYLFDGPLYVSWFISPETLVTDLRSFGRTSPRYLAVPAWESEVEVRAAAAEAGFAFIPLHISYRRDGLVSIVVYQLAPLP
jgi:4-amino-4-deoxy-L-arabinose transferase-like glycosyltransferase